jgi:uncharacterized protein YciI
MLIEGLNDHERAAYSRHSPWTKGKVADGTLIVVGRAGPGLGGSEGWALSILKADDEAAATAIMNADPFVAEGVVTPELFPFELFYLEPNNA